MKRIIAPAVSLTLLIALALSVGLQAQVKKDSKTGMDRLSGTIVNVNKDKTLTITQSGPTKGTFKVSYTDQTKVTNRNADAKADALKSGQRVIILGKLDKDVLVASRIDIRAE